MRVADQPAYVGDGHLSILKCCCVPVKVNILSLHSTIYFEPLSTSIYYKSNNAAAMADPTAAAAEVFLCATTNKTNLFLRIELVRVSWFIVVSLGY